MDEALEKRANPKFDYPGRMDEALEKRANPKFDYPGRMDEALEKRANPKFDYVLPDGQAAATGTMMCFLNLMNLRFFEARRDPKKAPLILWLNGGPGATSLNGALRENGPCFVGDDSNSTYLNPWSWNNDANVLYVDQPLHTGFSYTGLQNVSWSPSEGDLGLTRPLRPDQEESVFQNETMFVGTVTDRLAATTVNSTGNAMRAMWDFLQVWLADFPEYKTESDEVSIWGESYAGHYLPALGAVITSQNEKIALGKIAGKMSKQINLRTVGIINGCVDYLYQARAYPEMAFNNTYGIRGINQSFYNWATNYFDQNCSHDIINCQRLAADLDPDDIGNNPSVNEACIRGSQCHRHLMTPLNEDFGGFDIAHPALDPFPPTNYFGFLNQRWVQEALGVPLNSSLIAFDLALTFRETGDPARGGFIESLGRLLDQGISVNLMYGDRDFMCNWIGGENLSLAIPYYHAAEFREAGYQPLHVNESYVGGQIRQCGNLSFARVYQAGHEVPAYQPETAFTILNRTLHGNDISTGKIHLEENRYCTSGPSSTWHIKNKLPPPVSPRCYILDPLRTCTATQIDALKGGRAVIKDYVVVDVIDRKGGITNVRKMQKILARMYNKIRKLRAQDEVKS
ncbi:MAG: hypothetical protein Q9169_008120 [Polycauliona sp. 2 TL-2023]